MTYITCKINIRWDLEIIIMSVSPWWAATRIWTNIPLAHVFERLCHIATKFRISSYSAILEYKEKWSKTKSVRVKAALHRKAIFRWWTTKKEGIALWLAMKNGRNTKKVRPSYFVAWQNARPHVVKPVKSHLETLKWDITPSDYYLIWSMTLVLFHQKFTAYEQCIKWVEAFFQPEGIINPSSKVGRCSKFHHF